MSLEDKILQAKGCGSGSWAARIYAELGYAAAVSAANGHQYDDLVEKIPLVLIGEGADALFVEGVCGVEEFAGVSLFDFRFSAEFFCY